MGNNLPINFVGTTVVLTGTWYYAAFVRDGSTQRIYLNDTEENTNSSASGNTNTYDVIMGARVSDTPTQFFDGIIDEVRFSDIARSTAWIKATYNSGNDSLLTYGSEEGEAVGQFMTSMSKYW